MTIGFKQKKITRWEKVYVGPFELQEANNLVKGIREIANPEVNLIHDAKIRKRRYSLMYDVWAEVTKNEFIYQ